MINIAILGFGVVGGGIAEVTRENGSIIKDRIGTEVNVKYILDLREFPDSPWGDRVVHDIDTIVNDPEVSIVCEAMGGSHPALEFSLACMNAGKSVVTSNKEVVAKHGVELLTCAKDNGVSYLYEAAVGGGIPALRSLRTSLASDKINAITGILNGTTNYILTAMDKNGADFDTVLKEAQKLGYAEANPSADVDGIDAMRKIIILTAIATGKLVPDSAVYAETMTKVSRADMDAAKRFGGTVKLLGRFRRGDKLSVMVSPFFVPGECPLAGVNDVFNGIMADCAMTGEVMYYGRGAGRYPTAAAMVSDVFSIASGASVYEYPAMWDAADADVVLPIGEESFRFYVRIKDADTAGVCDKASELLGDVTVLAGAPAGYTEFITGAVANDAAMSAAKVLGAESVIRVLD